MYEHLVFAFNFLLLVVLRLKTLTRIVVHFLEVRRQGGHNDVMILPLECCFLQGASLERCPGPRTEGKRTLM